VQAFTKGVLCNWMVCQAIWMATAASTLPGKAVAVMFPIPAFVAIGLEHSVANMFLIPAGILAGAPVSWGDFFFTNLLPVTLGNAVAGVVCVALAYCAVFGKLSK
jgi:formate transporter